MRFLYCTTLVAIELVFSGYHVALGVTAVRCPSGNEAGFVINIQSTPENWNLQGKQQKVGFIGSSSYRG